MQRLLTGMAALAAVSMLTVSAQAACYDKHNVTADADQPSQSVVISTHDAVVVPPVATEQEPTEAAVACPADEKHCAVGTE